MSNAALDWARNQKTGDPTRKLILMLLADFAGPIDNDDDLAAEIGANHVTYVGAERIAADAEVHIRNVQRHYTALEEAGLIRRYARYRANGSRRTNYIALQLGGVAHDTPPPDTRATVNVTPVPPLSVTPVPPLEPSVDTNHEPKKTSSSSTTTTKNRGSRLPEDYRPTPQMISWAKQTTPNVGWDEHERFVDYWIAQPGQRGVKTNWEATWRNWMRKANDQVRRHPQAQQFKTAHEKRQESAQAAKTLIDRAVDLVKSRGGSADDNRAVYQAMQELKAAGSGMVQPYIDAEVVQLELEA